MYLQCNIFIFIQKQFDKECTFCYYNFYINFYRKQTKMIKPNSRMSYEQFIKLTIEQRQVMAQFFFKTKPGSIPVIVNKKSIDLPQLKNCKFLFNQNNELYGQLTSLRQHIIKNSSNKLTKDEQLFFFHKAKLLNSNQKIKSFYDKVKPQLTDGWLYVSYQKEATFGGNEQQNTKEFNSQQKDQNAKVTKRN